MRERRQFASQTNDIELGPPDVQPLSNADEITAFFARLGYRTDSRISQTPANLGISAEGTTRPIEKIELIADQENLFQVYLHGILVLVGAQFIAPNTSRRDKSHPYIGATEPDAINRAPTVGQPGQGGMNHATTLGEIVRAFKAATARQIRLAGLQEFGWQRNYYEHIIRNEDFLTRIRKYIATNLLRWELDRENP